MDTTFEQVAQKCAEFYISLMISILKILKFAFYQKYINWVRWAEIHVRILNVDKKMRLVEVRNTFEEISDKCDYMLY